MERVRFVWAVRLFSWRGSADGLPAGGVPCQLDSACLLMIARMQGLGDRSASWSTPEHLPVSGHTWHFEAPAASAASTKSPCAPAQRDGTPVGRGTSLPVLRFLPMHPFIVAPRAPSTNPCVAGRSGRRDPARAVFVHWKDRVSLIALTSRAISPGLTSARPSVPLLYSYSDSSYRIAV